MKPQERFGPPPSADATPSQIDFRKPTHYSEAYGPFLDVLENDGTLVTTLELAQPLPASRDSQLVARQLHLNSVGFDVVGPWVEADGFETADLVLLPPSSVITSQSGHPQPPSSS